MTVWNPDWLNHWPVRLLLLVTLPVWLPTLVVVVCLVMGVFLALYMGSHPVMWVITGEWRAADWLD